MKHRRLIIIRFLLTFGICSLMPVSGYMLGHLTVTIKSYGRIGYPNSTTVAFPWSEILVSFILPSIVLLVGTVTGGLILDYIREWFQKQKDGESRTPVVIKQSRASLL